MFSGFNFRSIMNDVDGHFYDDDNTTMDSSIESLGNSKYQKEYSYEKLLPYAEQLDDEARYLLAEIKGELGRATILRQLQPKCVFWTLKLRRFMKMYSLKFSKDDHIALIKLMYELVTIPNLEPYVISIFGSTLNKLLEKQELISPDEMELEWRPLYDLVERVLHVRQSALATYRYFAILEPLLQTIVVSAKVYFPVTATQEILDEIRPKLCPLDSHTMTRAIELLEWFLPVQLFPKDHHLGFKLWFDELMQLWEICRNSPQWEQSMMYLMAKLASHNIGYIDWEPHIPLMFTRFIRYLNLPVFYKSKGKKLPKMDVTPIALWIVSVLGNGSSCQKYMEKLLATIETFLHQANFGPWGMRLNDIFNELVGSFVWRLHTERYEEETWESPIPETHKLTDADVDAFVQSTMPIAMTAMYSKLGITEACNALQYLATVRPNLVIPHVLERMYSTLDSVTEPHKLTAALSSVASVARPMVQGSRNINKGYEYAEGPSQVVDLLFSFLPAIDANDASKCFVTCRLISVYAMLVPFVDTSRCTIEMDDVDDLVSETTSRFEDFVLQFFDRIFSLIEFSTLDFLTHENRTPGGVRKSKLESMAENAVASVCTVLLWQMSDTIFESALHKLRTFVTERVLETAVAGQMLAFVCRAFARINGRLTLRTLLPGLSNTILEIIGDTDEVLKDDNLDKKLLYSMLLLSNIVDTPGENLVPYMETITNVLDKMLRLKSREGIQFAGRLLQSVFQSLSNITVAKFLSNGRDYNDPEYPYFKDWGQGVEIKNVKINWYVPGENEVNLLQTLFTRYVVPEVKKIEDYNDKKITLTRPELLTSLTIISSILEGCEHFFPVLDDSTIDHNDPTSSWTPFLPTIGVKGEICMPDGSNVRCYMTKLMSNLQQTILSNSEDDTKSLFELVRIWNSLLLGKLRLFDLFETRYRSLKMSKGMLKDKLMKRKGQLGGVYIRQRVELHQECRMQTRYQRLTETHKQMFLELFNLATSRYADVRARAQHVLLAGLGFFPLSYTVVAPRSLEILSMDPDENHEALKGLLYLLLGRQSVPLMTIREWSFLRTLLPAIILSKPSEKLSVIRLKEVLVDTIHRRFSTIAITMEIPDRCIASASALWYYSPKPEIPHPTDDEIRLGIENLEKLSESNSQLYDGLVNDLLRAIMEENPHWRHRSMAMSFISDLVHPHRPYPPKIIRYFVNALVHESLDERKIAIVTVLNMLTQQKRIHSKVEINVSDLRVKDHPRLTTTDVWYPGVRLDNVFLQYNSSTCPKNEIQWNAYHFVHETHAGYYKWPKKFHVYAPPSQQPDLNPTTRELTLHETEISGFFNDPLNIGKLIKYNSLEERKGKDKFNQLRANLFKGYFRNHGNVSINHFLQHLRHLVADSHESSQRCAAEIIAGLIRGSKHWTFQMIDDMWKELTPIIRIALNNLTAETALDWGTCLSTSTERRDPNSQHWLLECLMEEPPLGDSTTSFIECCRLFLLQNALGHRSWRVVELMDRLRRRVDERLLDYPFQNVRVRLGSLLASIFAGDLRFPNAENDHLSPRVHDLIDTVMPKLESLGHQSNVETTNNQSTNNEQTLRLFKTICKWFWLSGLRLLYGTQKDFYRLFSIFCQLENSDCDDELSQTCTETLSILAQTLTAPCDIDSILDAAEIVADNESWSARTTCLNFIEVFVFYNMGTIISKKEWSNRIQHITLKLLEDQRVEVREKAAKLLGGLIHCTFIDDQEKLLEKFRLKSMQKIVKRDDLRLRHGAMLGLCAFIQANPYCVPHYVPSIFEHLRQHLNDPQPIPASIRKTLGDFKRTHYDGWAIHAQSFTEEQLEILRDLTVPPTYFA